MSIHFQGYTSNVFKYFTGCSCKSKQMQHNRFQWLIVYAKSKINRNRILGVFPHKQHCAQSEFQNINTCESATTATVRIRAYTKYFIMKPVCVCAQPAVLLCVYTKYIRFNFFIIRIFVIKNKCWMKCFVSELWVFFWHHSFQFSTFDACVIYSKNST